MGWREEIAGFVDNDFLNIQWKAFEPARISELKFKSTLDRIDAFLRPVCEAVRRNEDYKWHWSCEEKKWRQIYICVEEI